MKTEYVWLVEKNGVHLCAGFPCGNGWGWVGFTDSKALKFETKHCAEVFIRKNKIEDATAVEHGFVPAVTEEGSASD